MNLQTLNFALALPEMLIASMASVILMLGLFIKPARGQEICFCLSIGSLLLTAALIIGDFSTRSATAFNGLFVDDPMSDLLKVAICILSAAIFVYSRQYNQHRGIFQNEYYVLGLFFSLRDDGNGFGESFTDAVSRPGTDVAVPLLP